MINDTPWRTHHDVSTPAQPGELHTIRLATIDRQDGNSAKMLRERLEGLRNLQSQLTGRRKNQRLRVALALIDSGQDWQCERGSLAGTGLR